MSRDVFISLGLLAWFALLAVAEVATTRSDRIRGGDARLVTNFSLAAVNLLVSGIYPLATVTAAALGQRLGVGLTQHVSMSWLVILALVLVAQSLASYWLHRIMHQTSLLWRVHRVHHADNEVDVSTSLRNHPLELLLTLPLSALVVISIGAPVSVVVVFQAIMLAATIWQHADIALPPRLDRAIRLVLVTPRLHRLHHNPVRLLHDTNFGEFFTVWDRLFGTLSVTEGRGPVGLFDQAARPDHFLEQIWSPVYPTRVSSKSV